MATEIEKAIEERQTELGMRWSFLREDVKRNTEELVRYLRRSADLLEEIADKAPASIEAEVSFVKARVETLHREIGRDAVEMKHLHSQQVMLEKLLNKK